MASVTFQFDFFGLSYFVLFLIHGFAYFALRTYDEPIDAIQNKRGNKYNIRMAFAVLQIFITSLTLLGVTVGKMIYHFRSKPEETGVEGDKFSDDLLDVIDYACPDYDTTFTLLQNIFLFLAALIFFKTRKYEEQESSTKNDESYRTADPIQNIETMRNYQIHKVVQLVKDYKFKTYLTIYLELVVLATLSSVACTILNIPYVLLFLLLVLVLSFNHSQRALLNVSKKLTLIFISLLLVDLPTKYVIRSGHYATEEGYDSYLTEAIGLYSSTSTRFEFYFKVVLFLIECQKIQCIYDYQTFYDQVRSVHSEKPELARIFRKRGSFAFRVFKPVAIFMFCLFGLIFSLLRPSIILLGLMPLLIYGFFLNQIQFRGFAKMFMVIFSAFNIVSYTYRLVYLLLPSSQQKENTLQYLENIFGVRRTYDSLTDVFPGKLDFCFTLVMSFYSYIIQKHYRQSVLDEQQRRNVQQRSAFDEDILTVADDMSEAKSKISYRTTFNGAQSERGLTGGMMMGSPSLNTLTGQAQINALRQRITEMPEPIPEESKEYEQDNHTQEILRTERNQASSNQTKMIRKNHWNMQRDETLRGRMRRNFLKLYLKIKKGFDKFLSLLIIHSSKMGLLAIFIVSVLDANVLNAVLYVMFQLFSMFSYRNIRRFWKLTVIVDGLILIGMYVVDIFQNDFVKDISQTTQDIIGIQVNTREETKLREYCPYLILLVFLVLSDYILNSQRYENFLEIYHIVEMSSENQVPEQEVEEGSPLMKKLQKNQVGVSDYVTKFIIKTSIYILIVALFIECSILPVSILNFILLLFLTVIVYQYLYSESSIQMYQNLYITLVLLRWTSFLIVTLKYMFQFQDYTEHLSVKTQEELKTYFDDLPLVRRLFGMENSHVVIKLLCLALVMSLSNYQLKYLKYRYLADIVREQDQDWDRLYFWNYKNNTKFKRVMHYIMVYGIFLTYHASLIMPIIFLYRYSLKYISVIGFVVYLISVIIMFKQRDQFWQYQHRLIGMISCLLILTNYGIQFVYLDDTTNQKFIEWLGVEKQDKQVTATYDQLIPAFAILIICSLQKEAVKLYTIFKITVTQEDIDKTMEDLEKDNLKDSEYELAYKEKLEKMQTVFEYEKPIRQCLRFRDHYLKIFFYMYGYIILIFLFLFVIFYKLNLVSVQYSIQLVIFMVKGYYPLRFSQSMVTNYQRSKAENQMKIQIIVISFFMLVQYFLMIGPADEFDYTSWKEHFSTYFCYKNSEECYNDWKDYLSLLNVPRSHIIIDIILIYGCYLILFYLSGQIELSLDQIENNPKIRDTQDFISEKPESKLKNFIYYFIFGGFPYVFITYLLIFAATFHGAGAVDLISTMYLFFAMYYIIQFRKLYTSNSKLLRWLRHYNFLVLITLTIYQAPTFVCSSVDTFFIDTHYIARKKCADLELGNLEKLDKTNSWLAFYIVFAQSFGLIKIDSIQMDFIVLIILTEIQNHIFHHPYFQVYILQHMKEEKQTDGKLRAFMFVERSHLRILWAYKAIKEEIKILHQRLVRLNKAIRNQEFSKHLILDDEQDDYHDKQRLLTDEEKTESDKSDQIDQQQHIISDDNSSSMQLVENEGDKDKQSSLLEDGTSTVQLAREEIDKLLGQYIIDIENINLELMQQPDTPVVPMKYFIETLKMHLQQNKEFLDLIKNGQESEEIKKIIKEHLMVILKVLQKQIYQKNRIDLYYKEGLGLNFAIQKGSIQLMNRSDYKFYKHLILGSSINDALNNQNYDGKHYSNNAEANNLQLALQALPSIQRDTSIALDFEVQENYQENLSVIQDKIKPNKNKQTSIWKKLSSFLRHYIWNQFINKQLFYSITQTSDKSLNVDQIPILRLLSSCLFSQSQNICYLMLFINFIINTNLISLIPALSALLYALLDYPSANVKYWKFLMIYMLITVAVKFLYQLPIFCGTPAYEFFSVEACESYPVLEETLVGRIDYIIGVHKFSGPSSFPRDQGIVGGMACDVFVLFTLMLLKNYMIKIGQWHYVKNKNHIYQNPAFRCKPQELSEAERLNKVSRENYRIYEYEQSNIFGKISIRIRQISTYIRQFLLKLLPTNMKPYQKNLDLRTQNEMPLIHHSAKQVKPGKDFFASNFFSLLLIFVFNLFFYRNVTGDDKSGSLANISLDRFSILQVSLLFFILLLMLVERMLYRVRYFDSSNIQVQSGILAKHQLTIKLGLYLFLVFGVHLYLGFLIKRSYFDSFFKKFPVILSYMLWIYHLISSALQIRYGYPQAAFKPPFTRDTSPIKVWAFRVYKALPFLWEMKVIIDWTVTATCLDLYQWFKLDDAFNYLYANQFQNDDRRNTPEFAQRQWSEKFFKGFCFAFGLILVILAPILLFSGFNPILVRNPVQQANLQISFEINSSGNQHIILQTQAFNLKGLTPKEVEELQSIFIPINVKYDGKDLQMMRFSSYSEQDWSISPPSLQKLIQDYNQVKDSPAAYVEILSQWNFRRDGPLGNENTMAQYVVKMSANKLQPIIDMLSLNNQPRGFVDPLSNATTTPNMNQSSVYVENIFPKVFRLGPNMRSNSLEVQTLTSIPEFSSAYLTLKHDGQNFYWTYRLRDIDQKKIFIDKNQINTTDKDQIIITYNDQVIGSLFGSSFQLSIVGLYATIVIAIGRFLRIIFDRISQRVIYEEMPDTELLFEICEGIFIAQLEGDLVREKRLYDLLIRMYRSPETLIKITKARLKHHHKHNQQQEKEQLPQ